MNDRDKEPKIIIDETVMDDPMLEEDNLDSQSFGDDIVDGDDWDVDDFDGDFDDLDEGDLDTPLVEEPGKGNKKLLAYGVAGIIAVAVGGFLYTQMMPSGPSPDLMMAAQTDNAPNPAADITAAQTDTPEESVSTALSGSSQADDTGLLNDLSSLEDLMAEVNTPEAPTTGGNTNDELDDIFAALDTDPQGLPMPNAISSDLPTPEETIETAATETPVQDMASDDLVIPDMGGETAEQEADYAVAELTPMPDVMIEDPALVTLEQDVMIDDAPVANTITAMDDDRLHLVEQRLNALTGNLESLAMAVETMAENTPRISAHADTGHTQAIEGLEKTLQRLEKRVEELARQKKTTTQAVHSNKRPQSSASQKKASVTSSSANKTSTQWVLRGAMPGEAVVSRTSDGSVLTIKTGESLSGIGKIRSIGQENGQWVVQGSRGRIIH